MVYLLIQHEVKDYDTWKPFFDKHADVRKSLGSRGGRVFQSTDDPNKITILFTWDSIENARNFGQSDDLHQIMKEAGVVGEPMVYFLEEVEKIRE